MRHTQFGLVILSLIAALVVPVTPAARAQDALDAPPVMAGEAVSLLPPGNSGLVTADGQVAGAAGGSYGDNLDDQSDLYWGLEGYAGQGFADPADAVRTDTPTEGVTVYWDSFGVPAIYGDTGRDVWFGAGYAMAQIRLFLMDAVRRQGRGTFAELVGPSGVPMDVQTRTLTYSEAEYEAILASLSPEATDAVEGYVEGANAWIAELDSRPDLLPAEYALLSTRPEPLDAIDVLASGVLITRTVASEGGGEMDNVALLRQLEEEYGVQAGRGLFTDLVWNTDDKAVTTVPREEGTFVNQPVTDADAAFQAMADYAATLPLTLTEGPGTGAYPPPSSPGLSASTATPDPGAVVAARAAEQVVAYMRALRGGSIAAAIGPSRTAEGNALLLSGPQLGYSYPSLLVELEVHGGGYDARGASVPALPTVGIGYTDRVAWALTTGYSKTIDSYIETVRGGPGELEYLHDGQWKPAECRTEDIPFREAQQGLPVGPPLRSETIEVCRTVHGPIVAAEEGDGERLARSVQYQMFGREIETVEGVLAWNRAKDLEDFEAAMRQVTWNENTTYADADGHIAYWHPGIHRERPVDADLRLPMPGDGSFDMGEPLPFEQLPQSVDPVQGYLTNWNNKPAHGWFDGVGVGSTSRPGGAVQRVVNANRLIESRDDHSFETLQALEQEAGLQDVRAVPFVPLILQAVAEGSPAQQAVGDLIASWNGRHNDPASAPTMFAGPGGTTTDGTDGPAATVFDAVVEAITVELFGDIDNALVTRQLGVGSHVYDNSPGHNLALRVLDPDTSSLVPSRDYTGGRTTEQVIRDAVDRALADLTAEYGSGVLTDYRRPTAQSTVGNLTGVIGPSTTQPYQDRGSYIHVVGFDPPVPVPVLRVAGAERVQTSVLASRLAFPDGAASVVIASAGTFPDALTAGPLAGALDSPLLLVDGRLSDAALDEVRRLDPGSAVIVGGEAAVPGDVDGQLTALGLQVFREAGADRFETAGLVARRVDTLRAIGAAEVEGPDAYVVSGSSFADALSVGGVAARTATPILLTSADALPAATADTLETIRAESTVVVGGTAVVSDTVLQSLPGGRRVAGPDRYATAEAVLREARALGLSFDALVLATGANFPDGLSAAAVADAAGGVVVLVDGLSPQSPGPALALARTQRALYNRVFVLGGPAVIAEELVDTLR